MMNKIKLIITHNEREDILHALRFWLNSKREDLKKTGSLQDILELFEKIDRT